MCHFLDSSEKFELCADFLNLENGSVLTVPAQLAGVFATLGLENQHFLVLALNGDLGGY
jgi:hypothetical protein